MVRNAAASSSNPGDPKGKGKEVEVDTTVSQTQGRDGQRRTSEPIDEQGTSSGLSSLLSLSQPGSAAGSDDDSDRRLFESFKKFRQHEKSIQDMQSKLQELHKLTGIAPSSATPFRRSSPRRRRRRDDSDSDDSGEVKVSNIATFSSKSSIPQRKSWLRDLERAFEGSQRKYRTNKKRILKALNHMAKDAVTRWEDKVGQKMVDDPEFDRWDWSYFLDWTYELINFGGHAGGNVAIRIEHMAQKEDQSPERFAAELAAMEEHTERETERGRALYLFGKLLPDLQLRIQQHVTTLPQTRDAMLECATRQWNAMHASKTKKRKADDEHDQEESSFKGKRHKTNKDGEKSRRVKRGRGGLTQRPGDSSKPKENFLDKEGKPVKCYHCESTFHLANKCPLKSETPA